MTSPWKVASDTYDIFTNKDRFEEWYFNRFKQFFKDTTGWALYPPQQELARRILASDLWGYMDELAVMWSRQTGKTYCLAGIDAYNSLELPDLAHQAEIYGGEVYSSLKRFENGFDSGVFAPGERQAKICYKRSRKISRKALKLKHMKMNLDSMREWEFPNGSHREIFTAKEGSDIEGPTKHRIHIDEAQDVNDEMIRSSIYPMGAHTKATKILTGVPPKKLFDGTRHFVNLIQDPKRQKDIYASDCEVFFQYSDVYRDYVMKEIEDYGIDDIFIRRSYYLEMPVELLTFISRTKLEELANNKLRRIRRAIREPKYKSFYNNIYAGIDVGKHVDSSVAVILQLLPHNDEKHPYKIRLLDIVEIKGGKMDLEDQAEDVLFPFLANYSLVAVSYDYTSQYSFTEHMIREFRKANLPHHAQTQHIPVQWGPKNHNDVFQRLRIEMHQNRFEFPDDGSREMEEFKKQMLYLGHDYSAAGMLRCHSTDEKVHDDICSALALAVNSINVCYLKPEKTGRTVEKEPVTYVGGKDLVKSRYGQKKRKKMIMPRGIHR